MKTSYFSFKKRIVHFSLQHNNQKILPKSPNPFFKIYMCYVLQSINLSVLWKTEKVEILELSFCIL